MHNLVQGRLSDFLKQATPYFIHFSGGACESRLVTAASGNQLLLNRNSFPDNIFRVAAPGLSIATSHATISPPEITCFFTIFPVISVGISTSATGVDGKVGAVDVQKKVVLPLLRYVNTLQELCRFLDNENYSPFFTESDLKVRLRRLQADEDSAFREIPGSWIASSEDRQKI